MVGHKSDPNTTFSYVFTLCHVTNSVCVSSRGRINTFPSVPLLSSPWIWIYLCKANFMMCALTGPHGWKGPALGLMLCCCCPEILSSFGQETSHLYFTWGSHKLCSPFCGYVTSLAKKILPVLIQTEAWKSSHAFLPSTLFVYILYENMLGPACWKIDTCGVHPRCSNHS